MPGPIASHVSAVMSTQLLGPGIMAAPKTFNAIPPPYVSPPPALPSPPMASGGGIPSSRASDKASNPDESSSLSASGEVDPEGIDEDLEKIKKIEKEIKAKEEAQKAEQAKLDKEKEADTESKKKEEIEAKQKKLDDEKKITEEQRKQLEKIASPFAQKNDKGEILKDKDLNIQFLEKEQLDQLKQQLRIKDPETIKNVKEALEAFNQYRKTNPSKNNIETMDPIYSRVQKEASTAGPSSEDNALNTLSVN